MLTFCSADVEPQLSLLLSDRFGSLVNNLTFVDHTENSVTFDILFPNTLYIEIKNTSQTHHTIHLKDMTLAGLPLPDQILDQICIYRASDSDSDMVTRYWCRNGIVKIDFFASDWIQYHLLYGNKIIKS